MRNIVAPIVSSQILSYTVRFFLRKEMSWVKDMKDEIHRRGSDHPLFGVRPSPSLWVRSLVNQYDQLEYAMGQSDSRIRTLEDQLKDCEKALKAALKETRSKETQPKEVNKEEHTKNTKKREREGACCLSCATGKGTCDK